MNSPSEKHWFLRSRIFWGVLKKWDWKTFFPDEWRDPTNVVAPLDNIWSRQSFYVNRISRAWPRYEMLTDSWDTLYLVKIPMIIICFALIACRILEMTSVGHRANILEHGKKYGNQNSSPAAIPSTCFVSDFCKLRSIPFDTSPGTTLNRAWENGEPGASIIFPSPIPSEECL